MFFKFSVNKLIFLFLFALLFLGACLEKDNEVNLIKANSSAEVKINQKKINDVLAKITYIPNIIIPEKITKKRAIENMLVQVENLTKIDNKDLLFTITYNQEKY